MSKMSEFDVITNPEGFYVPLFTPANGGLNRRGLLQKLGLPWVAGQSGVAVPLTGTLTETVLATVPLPGGCMGANGCIRVTSYWTYTNDASNKLLMVRVGASGNGIGGGIWGATTQNTTRSMRMQNEIHNRNSQSSQVLMNGIGTGGWGTTINAASTDTRDTSVDMDLVFTGTLSDAADTIQLESYLVEVMYKE